MQFIFTLRVHTPTLYIHMCVWEPNNTESPMTLRNSLKFYSCDFSLKKNFFSEAESGKNHLQDEKMNYSGKSVRQDSSNSACKYLFNPSITQLHIIWREIEQNIPLKSRHSLLPLPLCVSVCVCVCVCVLVASVVSDSLQPHGL